MTQSDIPSATSPVPSASRDANSGSAELAVGVRSKKRPCWPTIVAILIGVAAMVPAGFSILRTYPNLQDDRRQLNEARRILLLQKVGIAPPFELMKGLPPAGVYKWRWIKGNNDQDQLENEHIATWAIGVLGLIIGITGFIRRRGVLGCLGLLLPLLAILSIAFTPKGTSILDLPPYSREISGINTHYDATDVPPAKQATGLGQTSANGDQKTGTGRLSLNPVLIPVRASDRE